MLDQLAGPHAVAYCGDAPAYLLKEAGARKLLLIVSEFPAGIHV
jgi:hypothetical protein